VEHNRKQVNVPSDLTDTEKHRCRNRAMLRIVLYLKAINFIGNMHVVLVRKAIL